MNRFVSIILLVLLLFGAWSIYHSPTAMANFDSTKSPVIYTTDAGTSITLAWAFFAIAVAVVWFALGALLSSLDPYLGYMYFRFTIELFMILVLRQKDFKMPDRSRDGGGSGKTNRVG